jgi:hypothetical protein
MAKHARVGEGNVAAEVAESAGCAKLSETLPVMLNRPRAMLERLAYIGWLGITTASLCALILSLTLSISGVGGELFVAGVCGTALSGVVNRYGRKHLHFDKSERSLELVASYAPNRTTAGHAERADLLRRLLDRWMEVDQQILDGKSDVWERQVLRRQAISLLAADPALRNEFEDELSAHPELTER